MLKFSKKVEYGLMSILHMDTLSSDALTTTKEISELYNMPAELLGKVLQGLAKAGWVESVHGAKGGYRLARPLESITVGDVIEALDGPIHLVRCRDDHAQCDQYALCNIRDPVMRIQHRLINYLAGVRLAEFRRADLAAAK